MKTLTQSEKEAAVAWIFEHSKAPTMYSKLLTSVLIFMVFEEDGTFCSPTIDEIREVTRIKSKTTVRKAVRELEEAGEWAVIRTPGSSRNTYHPMFIPDARTDLLTPESMERLQVALNSPAAGIDDE